MFLIQIIEVNLTSVTFLSEGTPSLDEATQVARVRIEASDAPHGVVEFAQSRYNASEGSTLYLEVTRHFGTAGDIRVFYRFVLIFFFSDTIVLMLVNLRSMDQQRNLTVVGSNSVGVRIFLSSPANSSSFFNCEDLSL